MVLDPQDRYPLVGSPAKVIDSKPTKLKREAVNQTDESEEKKSKLTFFDVSDGELSED